MTGESAMRATQWVAAVLAVVIVYAASGLVRPHGLWGWLLLLVASIAVGCGIVAVVVVTVGRRGER
jgi:hypothetical protein